MVKNQNRIGFIFWFWQILSCLGLVDLIRTQCQQNESYPLISVVSDNRYLQLKTRDLLVSIASCQFLKLCRYFRVRKSIFCTLNSFKKNPSTTLARKFWLYFRPGMLVGCFLHHFKYFEGENMVLEVGSTKFLETGATGPLTFK